MKTHIVGIDCRDDEVMAFPLATAIILPDMTAYRSRVQRGMRKAAQNAKEAGAMTHIPIPEPLLDLMGLDEAPEIPQEMRDHIAQQHGNCIDDWTCHLRAEVVVVMGQMSFPLRDCRLVTAEELLAGRVR
jgi:hypothetical protein